MIRKKQAPVNQSINQAAILGEPRRIVGAGHAHDAVVIFAGMARSYNLNGVSKIF